MHATCRLLLTAVILSITLIGCISTPTSKNPVSDQRDSKVDERLIGVWALVASTDEKMPDAGAKTGHDSTPLFIMIGRHQEKKNTMSAVWFNGKSGERKSLFIEYILFGMGEQIFATQGRGRGYLSMGAQGAYWLFAYVIDSNRQFMDWMLVDNGVVRKAIERGDLKGRITKAPVVAPAPPDYRFRGTRGRDGVEIKASSQELRVDLEATPEAFDKELKFRFRRLTKSDILRITIPKPEPETHNKYDSGEYNVIRVIIVALIALTLGVLLGALLRRGKVETAKAPSEVDTLD